MKETMLSTLLPCLENDINWEQTRISREIDRRLSLEKNRKKREVKILLLGTAEAGKTTLITQMTIIHGSGFPEERRLEHRKLVLENLYTALQLLLHGMDKLKIPYGNANNENSASYLKALDVSSIDRIEDKHIQAIKRLCQDTGVEECFRKGNRINLPDSTRYYLDSVDRIGQPEYIPTEQDILRLRAPTTCINEYSFEVAKRTFRMVDVGGQRSERRKWLHCFDGVESVIFVVAASEFDQRLSEDLTESRLEESISLFQVIIDHSILSPASCILFMNKQDRLEEKIAISSFKDYFGDFTGCEKDVEQVSEYITARFVHQLANKENVFPHHTTATDTENITRVFEAVQDTIMDAHLKETALG